MASATSSGRIMSNGAAVSGLNSTFQQIGGGVAGSIGGNLTWVLALIGCIAVVALLIYNRRQRRRFGFQLRPVWAEAMLAVVGCLAVLGAAVVANTNFWPKTLADNYAIQNGITPPPGGLQIPSGFPLPILILIGVTGVMRDRLTQ